MSCKHEVDPYPSEMIVVTEKQAAAYPLKFDWAPDRIVPCKKCGEPVDRGRYDRVISHPRAGRL